MSAQGQQRFNLQLADLPYASNMIQFSQVYKFLSFTVLSGSWTTMYLCYLDESGTVNPDDTSHFILAGLSIPIRYWRTADQNVSQVLYKYQLTDTEIHTAWMLRKYHEQLKNTDFAHLSFPLLPCSCKTVKTSHQKPAAR
ncbi:MAG: hypothetical protein OXE84_09565 [Rhodobacteraceae bacterium]|nr:hypothetical protein [Paracoccaceae bacterium]MCY4197914.1 hypothetical protein [Paracoccaceae bacterium]